MVGLGARTPRSSVGEAFRLPFSPFNQMFSGGETPPLQFRSVGIGEMIMQNAKLGMLNGRGRRLDDPIISLPPRGRWHALRDEGSLRERSLPHGDGYSPMLHALSFRLLLRKIHLPPRGRLILQNAKKEP